MQIALPGEEEKAISFSLAALLRLSPPPSSMHWAKEEEC